MQIYYFTRTGRSKKIAEQLASRYQTKARVIDDHRNWAGTFNYQKAALMALLKKQVRINYERPSVDDILIVFPLWAGNLPPAVYTFVNEIGKEHIIAVVTSLGSTLKQRDGFKKVIDLVGKEISVPENL